MALRLYDTLTREKRVPPIDPSNVRMYVCGPTVYDFAHIGNARPVIVFDVLFRLLRHLYGADHVTYVRNITDVDDKINVARARLSRPAAQRGDPESDGGDRGAVSGRAAALGCLPPTISRARRTYRERAQRSSRHGDAASSALAAATFYPAGRR